MHSVCICPSLNAKSCGLLIQLTSLMQIHDSAMRPLCMQKNPIDTYYFYMCARPFTKMQHPYDGTTIIHPLLTYEHTFICNMQYAI